MNSLTIIDFPLPPSVNTMLMPVMGAIKRNKAGKIYGSGRMVKSREHILYAKLCDKWAQKYKSGLDKFRKEIQDSKNRSESMNEPFCLEVSAFFMLQNERLFTVNNKIEKRDVDNLNKSLIDNLCRIIGIDDKHIFKINSEKCSTNKHEHTILKISRYYPRNEQSVLQSLNVN